MNSVLLTTVAESLYLFYMYFLFETKYAFTSAILDKQTQLLGQMFVHNTGVKENKVCLFGKCMAIVAIGLAFFRVYATRTYSTNAIFYWTIVFDLLCVSLAFLMNLNAFVYILPLIVGEVYILQYIINNL